MIRPLLRGAALSALVLVAATAAAPVARSAVHVTHAVAGTPGGPWGGNATSVAVDPFYPSHAVADVNYSLYRTITAGASWQIAQDGGGEIVFAYDPSHAGWLYAAGSNGEILLSHNDAEAWRIIRAGPTLTGADPVGVSVTDEGVAYVSYAERGIERSSD